MDATLTIVQPDGKTRDVPLRRPRTVIGRKPDCNIRVPVPSVSREHCELLLKEGRVTVRDLGSSNGTYVNRQRIQGEAPLSAGDLLALGPAVFVVRIDGEPATVNAQEARAHGTAPEPVAAAAAPSARPAAPAPRSAQPAPAGAGGDPSDSSVDFDFDEFLKDDDEKKL
ncbi:MAG: FHA domain-containing protein [Phycisphaerales bacterium]